jgi:hypothetical protein
LETFNSLRRFEATFNYSDLLSISHKVARAMASYGEDDFEMINGPSEISTSIKSKHDMASCSNPFCQLSHVSMEEQRASERAIEPLVTIMQANAAELEMQGPIFHTQINSATDRDVIFETFIRALPIDYRRVMNCNTCKQFLRQYGDLCIVGDDGGVIPLVFPSTITNVPQYYKQSVQAVLELFANKPVGEEFKVQNETARTLGIRTKGGWNHMSVTLEHVPVARANDSMNSQNTSTSFAMLDRILEDNSSEVISRVFHMIHENQLPYATSHKAPVTFLQNTVKKINEQDTKDPIKRQNLITKYARSAFPGCLSSLRGGILGHLFECVNQAQDFETLKRNWMTKADPRSYMRPTVAPSVGNIESAEKIFASMGYTPRDLERVFLTLDQVPQSAMLWAPAPISSLSIGSSTTLVENAEPSKTTKLFGNLLPAKSPKLNPYTDAPVKDISFRHFVLKVLPTVSTIEVLPPNPIQPYFFTTGKPGAKPIFAFHSDTEGSHTASWYVWDSASPPYQASLKEEWTAVKAIITFPHMWDELTPPDVFDEAKVESFKFKRLGIRILFVLDGARDMRNQELCLFPEFMKGEFHSVRKTVEACSKNGRIERPEGDHVGGIAVEKDDDRGGKSMVLGVRSNSDQVSRYRITLFE